MLAFNFHIGDFAKKTMHLTHEERGIYLSLLMRYYDTEQPLPAATSEVARLVCVRNADAMQTVCDVLAEFFVLHDDGWHNERADEELATYRKKSESAKKSAKARWRGASSPKTPPKEEVPPHSEGKANAMRTHSDGNANHEPRTTNHINPINTSPGGDGIEPPPPRKPKPSANAKSQPSDDDLANAFEVYWAAGMRKIDKKKARKSFDAIVKREGLAPGAFARQLYDDVQARLGANVFGFKQLHPTTYLNGERWNDEIISGNIGESKSPIERFEQAMRERDEREERGGVGVAQDAGNVRGDMGAGAGNGATYDMGTRSWEP